MNKLAKLNGISATIIACANCGLDASRIADKLASKYGVPRSKALAMVEAIVSVCAEVN